MNASARQGKARQGKARQGKARQGKARQGNDAHDVLWVRQHFPPSDIHLLQQQPPRPIAQQLPSTLPPCENRIPFSLNFPYVCPEPVLVK
jgi:hypothetical protein